MTDQQEETAAFLKRQLARYPMMAPRDAMKALYQSAFGCGHLVTDASAAAAYIRREAQTLRPREGDPVEPLNGPWCRVHLDVVRDGLRPETLAALFALSAEPVPDARERLEAKLTVLRRMTAEGDLPFDAQETEQQLTAWREDGYPAVHHSESFRKIYAPAYRLMKREYAALLPLFMAIDRRLTDGGNVVLALDGCCASGKTTLAALLERVYGCTVFHMDDFFLRPEQRTPARYAEPGGNVDRERFLEEVLTPLRRGETVYYRRFDCGSFTLMPPKEIVPTPLCVIEGSYSLHPALRDAYDLTAFLRIAPQEQLRRIAAREGEEQLRHFEERWIPLEKAYHEAFRLDEHCDFLIDNGRILQG